MAGADHKVEIIDYDEDSVVTAYAGVDISGGMFVASQSGAWYAPVENSGTMASFAANQLVAYVTTTVPSGLVHPIGVALQDTASGGQVAIAKKGTFIAAANGTITIGKTIGTAVATTASAGCVGPTATASASCGTALTSATSGTWCVISLNL